jgi:hypothetical protein
MKKKQVTAKKGTAGSKSSKVGKNELFNPNLKQRILDLG